MDEILTIYQDCQERKALPDAGGVLDQSSELMHWFRIIDERTAEFKRKREEQERMRTMKHG